MSLVLRAWNRPALHSKRSLLYALHLAAQAELPGVRDDLLKRRIGGQEAFQQAREFGIGAGELGRRRRAIGLGVAAIERQARMQQVGAADHRIEALERVVAVELRRVAGVVVDLHTCEVVTAADGEGELARQVDRVREVEAVRSR